MTGVDSPAGPDTLDPDPWPPAEFAAEVAARVTDYLAVDGRLSLPDGDGPIHELERAYADLAGTSHALACSTGTAALHSAFLALELAEGEEVLASPYSFHSTVTPLLHIGAQPVFADIDPDSGNLCPASLEGLVTSRTRALVVTHMYGRPADMPAIVDFARRHRLRVIEDCSHAHGATLHGRPAGSWGDIGIFSLQAHKPAPAGEGGILVTDDAGLFERAVLAGHFGGRAGRLADSRLRRYAETGLGLKLRMHPLAAVTGLAGLDLLRRTLPLRRRHAAALADAYRGSPWFRFDYEPHWTFYLFRLMVRDDVGLQHLDALLRRAAAIGVPLRMASLRPLTELPLVQEGIDVSGRQWRPRLPPRGHPGMDSFVGRCLSIPTWTRPESRGRLDAFVAAVEGLTQGLSS